jgi:hypothetical protein
LDTHSVPLNIRYFHEEGFFAELSVTYVHQEAERREGAFSPDGTDEFVLFDSAVGYRLPKRRGIISIEGRNLTDESFDFQDDRFRSSRASVPIFIPERTVLVRGTFNF